MAKNSETEKKILIAKVSWPWTWPWIGPL